MTGSDRKHQYVTKKKKRNVTQMWHISLAEVSTKTLCGYRYQIHKDAGALTYLE